METMIQLKLIYSDAFEYYTINLNGATLKIDSFRENNILQNLKSIERNFDVPKEYLCLEFTSISGETFQLTNRPTRILEKNDLSIIN